MTDNFITWVIPLDRVNWRLGTQDILDALAYFKERTGKVAKKIILHPSTLKLRIDFPEGLKVFNSMGVLAHEVFIDLSTAEDLPTAPETKRASVTEPLTPLDTVKSSPAIMQLPRNRLQKPVKPETPKGIMQHPKKEKKLSSLSVIPVSKRGRPLKRGEVHRTTEWRRRKKQKQVVLL